MNFLTRFYDDLLQRVKGKPKGNFLKRFYHWMLHWAKTKYASWALFLDAFLDSSFLPIFPPDILLIILSMGHPERSLWFATICATGSTLGSLLGIGIGWFLWGHVHTFFFQYLFDEALFHKIEALYRTHAFWVVVGAGLTPLPHALFTIGAGACHVSFPLFLVATVIGRFARFFLVGSLFYFLGPRITRFIERNFSWLPIALAALIAGMYFLVNWLIAVI